MEYEKPESFQKHKPEPIEAPKPKYYPETEKPYVPLELTTPNVSYYLPDYKPVNPEVPVVHGLPSAPKPKVEKLHIKNPVLSITYKIAVIIILNLFHIDFYF